jgi:hypothetical protein
MIANMSKLSDLMLGRFPVALAPPNWEVMRKTILTKMDNTVTVLCIMNLSGPTDSGPHVVVVLGSLKWRSRN